MELCTNCHQEKPIVAKGLCSSCYIKNRATGKDRPLCSTCMKSGIYAAGECKTCWSYRNNTGTQRPERLWSDKSTFCKNCKVEIKTTSKIDMCEDCRSYLKRNGENRPDWLWDSSTNPLCENCGIVIRQGKSRRTLCVNCQNYLNTNGENRPEYLWKHIVFKCENCDTEITSRSKFGLCLLCRRYLKRNGKSRPEQLWEGYIRPKREPKPKPKPKLKSKRIAQQEARALLFQNLSKRGPVRIKPFVREEKSYR